MKKHTTAERLKEAMELKGLRQADLIKEAQPYCKKLNVKLGKSIMSQYLSGNVVPGQDKITILSLALNVSEAWLMGYDVPIERDAPAISIEANDGRSILLWDLINLLTDAQKDMLIAQVKGLLSSQ